MLRCFRNNESPPNFVPERWQNNSPKMPNALAGTLLNYTSIDPKQQQRMFPPRSCAIQNSWNCLAHSCLLFYSFITSTVQIRGNKRDAPTHPGIHTEWRSLIFRRVQNWYKLFSLENNSASTSPWNRTLFLRKERREKKGDKHRNQRRENKGDKHRNPSRNQRNQQIMMEQNPFPEERKKREEGRHQQIMMEQNLFPEERKKREEGRQAPEPEPEPRGTSKS